MSKKWVLHVQAPLMILVPNVLETLKQKPTLNLLKTVLTRSVFL